MERGKGLQRKTPLKQGKPLESRTPLKSGKGLQRKTPLSRGTPTRGSNGALQAGKGLGRQTPLKPSQAPQPRTPPQPTASRPRTAEPARGVPQPGGPRNRQGKSLRPKPAKGTADERRTRKLVAERSGGLCERCHRAPATDKAHRVSRGVGGAWCPSNILDLCHRCHMRHHQKPDHAYAGGWHLRSHQDPAQEPAFIHHDGHTGWARLESDGTVHWTSGPLGGTP